MATSQNRPRQNARRRRFYKRKGFWLGFILLALIVCGAGLFFAERHTRDFRARAATYDLDKINILEIPSSILDRNGKEIGFIFVQNRSVIPIAQVPDRFINALVAGEDSRFFSHGGVDFMGIGRAIKMNLEGSNQGASTITQQLARNAYDLKGEALRRGESEFDRKFVEMFLAMRIERRYSKREILEFYLNRIYFGSGFYGIRSAALGYFGKEPMELTTAECASLVTLIKNPTGRSPINNPTANLTGRNYVLGRMVEEKFLKPAEAAAAMKEPLVLNPHPIRRGTSHLYERIAEAVGGALGEDALSQGGFKIHTTIVKEAQDAIEKEMAASLDRAEARPGYSHPKHAGYRKEGDKLPEYLQGAALMIDHDTGEVLAYVGGRDYSQVPFDFIDKGKRPLGTAFFPFLYASGLSSGLLPTTMLKDEALDNRTVMIGGLEGIVGEWGMETENPTYKGTITARRALEQSKIAASVDFGNATGLQRVAETATAFGFPMKKAELLPRLCLGWEEASMKQAVTAMAVFARGGRAVPEPLQILDRIEDSSGSVRYQRPQPATPTREVIDSATAWQIHSMMAGSDARGSSRGLADGLTERPFSGAAKGGTTHDFADTWFLGYNRRVTCGVWTGFLQANAGSIYPGAFSRDLSMPIWQAGMNAIAASYGGGTIEMPHTVTETGVCADTGQRLTRFCLDSVRDPATGKVRSVSTAITEYFRQGTEPTAFCAIHSGAPTDTFAAGSNRLPPLAETPVVPTTPVVLGSDPYHAEVPSATAISRETSAIRTRTDVIESLDIDDGHTGIPLPPPGRMEITE